MEVYDEYGHPWKVGSGSPATPIVNKLKKLRYELAVLPCLMLATGKHYEPDQYPEGIVQRVRLADCLDVVRGRPE